MTDAKQTLVVVPDVLKNQVDKLVDGPTITFVQSLINNIEQFTISVSNRVVATEQDAQAVTNAVKQLKVADRKLDDKRKEVTGPIRDQEKTVNEWFRLFTVPLREGMKDGNASLKAYLVEKERKARETARLEAERKAAELKTQAEAQLEAAVDEESYPDRDLREQALRDAQSSESVAAAIQAAPLPQKSIVSRGGIGTAGLRKTWKAKVVDVKKLPRHILEAPKVMDALTSVLSAMAKQYKEGFAIDGAEAYEETGIGIR